MSRLSAQQRKENIERIRSGDPIRTGEKLFGSGRQNVYAISLEFLTYNPSNSRFRAEAKTFEAENGGRKLDVERDDDYQLIENYIWKLSVNENENTIKSLLENGQQQVGIVTRDGVVLSGNRRLRLLNEIQRNKEKYLRHANGERLEELSKFEAIILDEEHVSPNRMVQLEVHYQYGEETKVGYNSIQKYLSAYDQKHENGFSEAEIAKNFNVTKAKVAEWLEIYELMTDYLDYTEQQNRFTALYELEDPFIHLRSTLKKLKGYKTKSVNWVYGDEDIELLKMTYFDFLYGKDAIGREKSYRQVLSFFNDGRTWKQFVDDLGTLKSIDEYKPIDDYEKENPNLDPEIALEKRRSEFAQENKEVLEKAFIPANIRLTISEVEAKPYDQLKKTSSSLAETLDFVKDYARKGKKVNDGEKLSRLSEEIIALAGDIDEYVSKIAV